MTWDPASAKLSKVYIFASDEKRVIALLQAAGISHRVQEAN